jgi:CheY-like chemotaxis protein
MPDCAVLVVEDDHDSCDGIVEVLHLEGYRALGAGNGREALEILRAGRFAPDVILIDLWMPTMSGPEFREALLEDQRFARIPVVACTGDTLGPALRQTIGTLEKPIDIDALLAIVHRGCSVRHGGHAASA